MCLTTPKGAWQKSVLASIYHRTSSKLMINLFTQWNHLSNKRRSVQDEEKLIRILIRRIETSVGIRYTSSLFMKKKERTQKMDNANQHKTTHRQQNNFCSFSLQASLLFSSQILFPHSFIWLIITRLEEKLASKDCWEVQSRRRCCLKKETEKKFLVTYSFLISLPLLRSDFYFVCFFRLF